MELLLLILGVMALCAQSQLGVQEKFTISKFVSFDSESCVAYCNGEQITNFEVTCDGTIESKCLLDGFNAEMTCLGSFKYSVSDENLVDSYCKGLFYNSYKGVVKGELIEGGTSCGGTHKLAYTVASKTSISPNGPVNETCLGTFGTVQYEGPAPSEAVAPSLNIDEVRSLMYGESLVGRTPPPGFSNCVYTCNSEASDAKLCKGEQKVTCDVQEDEGSAKWIYTCSGVFGGGWSKNACVGGMKVVQIGADYVYTQTCSEAFGVKIENGESESACQGDYIETTVVTAAAAAYVV